VQVGYDWITHGALGGHLGSRFGDVALVRTMNEQMRVELPGEAAFVDLAEISGQMGRESFYDPRRDCWTRQPFSEAGAARLAEHLYAAVRAVTTGPKKALILDLDDTLWGGVVGDLGPLGIGLGESAEGEAYRTFQGEVSRLARRGIVLAVASKNNRHDAVEAFEKNPDMVLSLDDFAAFEACWDPKDQMIRRIAEHLGLGLEHLVFFDDNPAERELIRQALPEVSVVEVPEEPAEYVRALYRGLFFESCSLTADDLARTVRYRKERARRDLERSAPSMDAYLTSLEMRGVIRDIDDADMQRVVQLLGKTNQWNLTTRRLSHAEVCALLEQPGSLGLTLRLSDRFGDHGLVAVLLAVRDGDTLRISDWLMSCRVIGRTAEQLLFRRVLELARDAGVRFLEGEYRGTKKNGLVSALYSDLGFECSRQDGEQATYLLDLNGASPPQTFVRPE
jgi:FkbH-like protein